MAIPQQIQKVGAHSNQETRPRGSSSPRPIVAPDSQPPSTGRKRKHRTLSLQQQDLPKLQPTQPTKRRRTSKSSWDRRQRELWDSLSRLWLAPDALRELDRRNALPVAEKARKVCKIEPQIVARDVEHFARHGGPDLSDLRQVRKLPLNQVISDKRPVFELLRSRLSFRVNAFKRWEELRAPASFRRPGPREDTEKFVRLLTKLWPATCRQRNLSCKSRPQSCESSGVERSTHTAKAISFTFSHV